MLLSAKQKHKKITGIFKKVIFLYLTHVSIKVFI